jgi:hypothetical protein
MTVNDELGRMWAEADIANNKVLSQLLRGETKENRDKF